MYFINNFCLNLIRDIHTQQPSLNPNNVKDIMKQDPFELICVTWLHILEYGFQFMIWNFPMLAKCSYIFGFWLVLL
jgi:hypothetical protein